MQSALSAGWKATLSGLLLLGLPELAILVAVAILGKSGYQYLKEKILLVIKRRVIPKEVSRTRYRLGLVVFFLPILWGWASPYVQEVSPLLSEHRIGIAVGGDVLLVVGLVLLGGEFWEKLRQLFTHRSGDQNRKPV
jgi:hypothetical protein